MKLKFKGPILLFIGALFFSALTLATEIPHKEFTYIRHGVTDANVNLLISGSGGASWAEPLNAKGKAQSRDSIKYIMALPFPISMIFHSPQLRARQTAEIIQQEIREKTGRTVSLVEIPDLREVNFGEKDATLAPSPKTWPEAWEKHELTIPGAETPEEVGQRVVNVMTEVLGKAPPASEGIPLVVAHGTFFRQLSDKLGIGRVALDNARPIILMPPEGSSKSWRYEIVEAATP